MAGAQSPTQIQTVAPGNPCVVSCDSRPTLRPGDYAVQDMSRMEMITQPLFSYQSYPAAGAASFSFFQSAVGQNGITAEDTNMQVPSQLPAPQAYLIQAIGIDYLPGIDATKSLPVILGAAAVTGQANDFWTIMRRGVFTLTVGSKDYLTQSPLMSMPPRSHMGNAFATSDATTAAANLNLRMNTAFSQGPVLQINPILLQPSMNFRATISFPGGAIAIPSTDATARIGVVFYGTLYRPPQ